MNDYLYIVKGRSIDGTVYCMGEGMWGNRKADAKKMSHADAVVVLTERQDRNRFVDPDAVIGRLDIIPAN